MKKDLRKFIENLTDEVIKTKDIQLIIHVANNVSGVSINKLTNAVIDMCNAEEMIEFASKVPNVPIEKLANIIIENYYYVNAINFAKQVPNAPIKKMANKIIDSFLNNNEYWHLSNVVRFALEVPGAPTKKMLESVVGEKINDDIENLKTFLKESGMDPYRPLLIKYAKNIAHRIRTRDFETCDVLKTLILDVNEDENIEALKIYLNYLSQSFPSYKEADKCDEEYQIYLLEKNKIKERSRKI